MAGFTDDVKTDRAANVGGNLLFIRMVCMAWFQDWRIQLFPQ